MKIKSTTAFITLLIMCSFTNPSENELLFLESNQLKKIGIVVNENGLFYKNYNPNWENDHSGFSCLSFFCVDDIYFASNHYNKPKKTGVPHRKGRYLRKMETTRNDFYPLLVGNQKGILTLDNATLPEDMKLFPVAVCMADTKLPNRTDTIVMWFKLTPAMMQALPPNTDIHKYLRVRKQIKAKRGHGLDFN